ncbi:MAG: GPR endopeptidase [Clostridia bacterium]
MSQKIKELNFRTDMADERVDTYKKYHNLTEIDGVKISTFSDEKISTTIVEVLNENGQKAVSKQIGKYITIQIDDIDCLEVEEEEKISSALSKVLKELIGDEKEKSILVVGLGNEQVTPDSLGPKVAQNIEITRHILNFAKELATPDTREISAISPGVLGTTGIETSEIVFSIVKKINASMVIVIDALASQSISRIGNTVQLSNTGITPGAGVRNKREGINKETLGIPVIAIGVPTVVDMATITNEAINKILKDKKVELTQEEESNRYETIANILDTQNYIVTPKEIDEVVSIVAKIIAKGINISVQ